MNYQVLCALLVLAAYLIGALPFGYLIARWARGIDIRTVGSGNIGATNVGRTLGFRFFVIVFTLDLLKGFLPTLGFPRLAQAATGQGGTTLGVLVALATILGHNFPVYLRFRGGKGVATSLGSLLALDATAALAAAGGFGITLLATRYVSVSSILGGVAFAAVHFSRAHAPWSRDQIAMSLLTIGLLVLLIGRHRTNLARVWSGTEPRVPLGRRIVWLLLIVLALAGVVTGLVLFASKRAVLSLGGCTLNEVARVATGHQRAERLAFADSGRLLAVTCPRYNRVVLYRVNNDEGLDLHRDIELDGRPVAIWPVADRFFVLQRPPGDSRHLEPGYWETFDFAGRRIGSKYRVGFYPDDLAITPDGRHALVLTSGRAEGGASRPQPALTVIALGQASRLHRDVARVDFDRPGDDPERLALSANGRWATITLGGKGRRVTVDLNDLERPSVVASDPLPSPIEREGEGESVRLELPALGDCVACTRPQTSGLDLYEAATLRPLGRLRLRGAWNLSPTRPAGIARATGRGLIAVATRSGSVHLIAIRPGPDRREVAGSEPGSERR